jgi:hypothetical protein
LGIFSHAKSRAGSHISDTAAGRYAPTEAAKLVLTFCDVRRIIPNRVPLCLREGDVASTLPLLVVRIKSGCESLAGLRLRSRNWGDNGAFV